MAEAGVPVRVLDGGRIVIPARFRRALGIQPGDSVTIQLADGELRLATRLRGIRRAQEIVRRHVPPGASLSDELVAQRRAEAEAESH
jgi:AbrB family looped-hinge helix DNA binding protein